MTTIYLPLIHTDATQAATGRMAANLTQRPPQLRPVLQRNEILMQVAQARAFDMATRNYFGHTDPDGLGPNHHARRAGFVLPAHYSTELAGNNIESLGAGFPTADDCWYILTARSPGHRVHLLGEGEFYAEQDSYGVGYVWQPRSTWHHFYCFIVAKNGMSSGE